MLMHAQKVSPPPFAQKSSAVLEALIKPEILPSQVNYAVETVRQKWAAAMLDDALLVLLQVGQCNQSQLKKAHACMQFGLVCAIYSGLREGMPDFEQISAPMADCCTCVRDMDSHISATLAVQIATALELSRRFVRNATSKAIYQTCVAVEQYHNVRGQ